METIGEAHETHVEGTSIVWGELGSGEPLVLLHGLMDSHRTWRRVAPLLARDFRVLMPDLPGCGWSGRPDAPYTLPWYAHTVAAWMHEVGVAQAHLAGHSYGAGIAQWMLLDERLTVRRLALLSAGGLGREVALGMRLAAIPWFGRRLTPSILRVAIPLALRLVPQAFGHVEPAEARLVVRMSRIPGSDRAFERALAGVINFFGQYVQTVARVHEVSSLPPIALFWGTEDPVIPIRHGSDLIAKTTGVTLTAYPGCGHYPQLDAAPNCARDLREFLLDPHRQPAKMLPVLLTAAP